MRTSQREVDSLVTVLNNRLGRPQYGWTRDAEGGGNRCAVGALTIDRSYGGGSRLHEVVDDGGGVRELSPRLPAGEMADYLRGMLVGIDLAEASLTLADPSWVGIPHWSDAVLADRMRRHDYTGRVTR